MIYGSSPPDQEPVLEKGILSKEELDQILVPENMIKPEKMKLQTPE